MIGFYEFFFCHGKVNHFPLVSHLFFPSFIFIRYIVPGEDLFFDTSCSICDLLLTPCRLVPLPFSPACPFFFPFVIRYSLIACFSRGFDKVFCRPTRKPRTCDLFPPGARLFSTPSLFARGREDPRCFNAPLVLVVPPGFLLLIGKFSKKFSFPR